MTKFIDIVDIEELTKYMDFEDLNNIVEDLTPGEIKEKKAIDNKYKELFEKLKTELADLHPEDPPKNYNSKGYDSLENINIEDYKEWKEYEKKGSKKWHNKRTELYNLTEDYKKQVDDFIIKVQERRFTEIIKNVGIEKFFQDRIKAAEVAIKKAIGENKDPKTKVYTDYGLNEIINKYEEVIKTSKEVLDKLQSIDSNNIQDLSFSELLNEINIKSLMGDKEEIELLNSIIPQNYIIPNNRLINKMVKDEVPYSKEFELRINKEAAKKEILTKVSLNYDDNNIQIYDKDKRFTPYDRSVHNAICSLYEAGNINFTPEQIYRCMNGFDDSQYVSPQAVGAITKSLDKSRRILANINYTDEAKAYKKGIDSCIVEDYILSAKKVTLGAGGYKVTGYKLNSKPILYEYAQVTGQILTVPSKLLNTKDVIRSTPEVIIIREYLIRRIEVMKRNNNQSNCILLERVYEEINEPEPTKKKTLKVRNIIEKLLSKFVSEKYIKNFEFYKEGRAFKGVEIIY